jgi:predicted DNA-binding protein
MTPKQAREILDTIIRQVRMTREDHSLAAQAIEMLYDGARENEESKQAMKEVA